MQLQTTSVSPAARRARIAARSSIGIEPSRCSARTPGAHEFVADVDAVADAAGEGHGLAALAILEPVRDDVADELVPIHALGELGLDVVAGLRLDAAQIRIDWRVDPRLHQVPLLDEVGDLRALDHRVEDAAEPATIATAWCCGESKNDRVGICLDDLLIGHGPGVVGLVDDQEIGERHEHNARPDRARMQRLDRGDLHRSHRPQLLLVARLDDAVRDAASGQLVRSLVHDLTPVGDHEHATGASGDDGCGNYCLARASWRYK
jgi:hypothetical protein